MSLQTLIELSGVESSLGFLFANVHSALIECKSVSGLISIHQLAGDSYVKLKRHPILEAADKCFIEQSELAGLRDAIDECREGFQGRWEVTRFRPIAQSNKLETWTYYLDFLFEPVSHRSVVFAGIQSSWFMDAGSQRYFTPGNVDGELGREAAKRNLQLLVKELCAVATIPNIKLRGIPVHLIDPENDDYLESLWLLLDGNEIDGAASDVEIVETPAGPLYLSSMGPLGSIFAV